MDPDGIYQDDMPLGLEDTNVPRCRIDSALWHPCIARGRAEKGRERWGDNVYKDRSRTSFCQPLLSFWSKPALIDATPVLYEKSRAKYLKKSINLWLRQHRGKSQRGSEGARRTAVQRFRHSATAIAVAGDRYHQRTWVTRVISAVGAD